MEFALGNMGRIDRVGSKPKARFYWGFCKGRVRLMTFFQTDDFFTKSLQNLGVLIRL